MSTATMSDTDLQRDVLDELKWEPSVNAAHIGVSVKDGIVTLSGHVDSYMEKYAAEKAAKRIHGVMAVANEIDVKLPGSSQRTDEDIAAGCLRALEGSYRRALRQDQSHRDQGLDHARGRGRMAISKAVRGIGGPQFGRRDRH